MPIPLRVDYNAGLVRLAAKKTKNGPQARRLLALAAIFEGASRTEAARLGGVTVQIVRDWVVKFNAHGPDGLIDQKAPGKKPRLNGEHRAALANRRASQNCLTAAFPSVIDTGLPRWLIRNSLMVMVPNGLAVKLGKAPLDTLWNTVSTLNGPIVAGAMSPAARAPLPPTIPDKPASRQNAARRGFPGDA